MCSMCFISFHQKCITVLQPKSVTGLVGLELMCLYSLQADKITRTYCISSLYSKKKDDTSLTCFPSSMNILCNSMANELCSDIISHPLNVWFIKITHECSLSWTCIRQNCCHGSKWFLGRPFESLFHQCWHIHTWLLFQFLWVDFQIYILNTHIHTQTIRAVAGRHSALHPVVSLHASKLFSVTQILIWKSQLTELTETREKGSKDPLSSFHCPFIFVSLLHLTDTFWCQQLLILILCPFHTGYSEC